MAKHLGELQAMRRRAYHTEAGRQRLRLAKVARWAIEWPGFDWRGEAL